MKDRVTGWSDPRDEMDDVNDCRLGQDIAESIAEHLARRQGEFSAKATYLALGAGRAEAELALAGRLGVQTPRITLVDKQFSSQALRRFQQVYPEAKVERADMFEFLGAPTTPSYDLVSAIGVDYLFNEKTIAGFIEKLSGKVKANGYAVLHPYYASDITKIWKNHGFRLTEEWFERKYPPSSWITVRNS